jgi:hypothetical protein
MTVAACTKNDGSKIVGDPPSASDAGPTASATSSAPAPALTNDGLAAPPTDELVYRRGPDECDRVPDGVRVQCPPGGPTGILPDPDSITVAGGGSISLQYGTLRCLQSGPPTVCPKGVMCNPPPPETVTCPDALMPKLSPGVVPTKRDGAHCWFGSAEVACPASTTAPGDCPKAHPTEGATCPKFDVVCRYEMKPVEGASAELCACVRPPPVTTMPPKTGNWACHADPKAPVVSK